METKELIKTLGKKGLLERLSPSEREEGLSNWEELFQQVGKGDPERVQGIGDDFLPDTYSYNAIGAIYPLLNVEDRKKVTGKFINRFDGINYNYVQNNHTSYIREPLLLADILLGRWIYFPGLFDEEKLWEGKESFSELEKEIIDENGLFKVDKVNSDFLVAYALMRTDITPFGEDYIKAANPKFLDRVIEGVANLGFNNLTQKEEIETKRKTFYGILPKSIHEKFEKIYTRNKLN